MNRLLQSAAAAAVMISIAGAASAQFVDTVDELNEDLIEAIEDDAERDLDRFGNEGRPQGFSGSFALRADASDSGDEDVNIGIGTDLGYVFGPNGVELGLNYSFSDDNNNDEEQALFYNLEYTRDLNPRLFGFAKLQGSVERFTDEEDETDNFLSFGAGYRIYNTPTLQWSVQAGLGYRYAELGIDSIADTDFSEPAIGISSDYAHRLTETLFVTNDTDIIASDEAGTTVRNDLALSVAMTDSLALRTSVITNYNTERDDRTTNDFGLSIVYSFN